MKINVILLELVRGSKNPRTIYASASRGRMNLDVGKNKAGEVRGAKTLSPIGSEIILILQVYAEKVDDSSTVRDEDGQADIHELEDNQSTEG